MLIIECIYYIFNSCNFQWQILYPIGSTDLVWIYRMQNKSINQNNRSTVYHIFGTTNQLLIRYCTLYIWHNRSTAHQIRSIVYLVQQINCSSDTVYCIFGTTDQLLTRYSVLYIWHNKSTAHQILCIVYLPQQINCSSDTVYCIFGTTDQLLIRYCMLYIHQHTHFTNSANAIKQYIIYSQTSSQPMIQLGGRFL